MKRYKLLFLIGIVLIGIGLALSSMTTQKTRNINLSGQWVNGTRTVDLGMIHKGEKIRLAFRTWCEDTLHRNILITLVRSDTGEIIPERRYPRPPQIGLSWNASQDGYTAWGEYFPTETARYKFLLSWAYPGLEPKPIKLVTFEVYIIGPTETPYIIPGAGIIIVGIALLVLGLVKRRSAEKG